MVCRFPTPPVVGRVTGAVSALASTAGGPGEAPFAMSVKKSKVAAPLEEYWRLTSLNSRTLRKLIWLPLLSLNPHR